MAPQSTNGETEAVTSTTTREETSRPNEQEEQNDDDGVSFDEVIYGVDSYYAIVRPVFLTMLLSALSVVYISTPESRAQGEDSLSDSYVVLKGDDDDTNGKKLGQSVVNGLIIVSVIGVLTFGMVLLYKYRCMKCLVGYLVVASTMLLGFLASEMFRVAIDRYGLGIDKLSFAITMYNFAIVGTVSIFFGKGIPTYVGQGYLIASSVVVAWHLSHFDPWTAWVLLIMLALYDLFAVLSPCGPLKALVKLMQKDDAPEMPGLLYEANLPGRPRNNNSNRSSSQSQTTQRSQQQQQQQQKQTASASSSATANRTAGGDDPEQRQEQTMPAPEPQELHVQTGADGDAPSPLATDQTENRTTASFTDHHSDPELQHSQQKVNMEENGTDVNPQLQEEEKEEEGLEVTKEGVVAAEEPPNVVTSIPRRGQVPLALAINYRLRFERPVRSVAARNDGGDDEDNNHEDDNWTPEELQQMVTVVFPSNGWRIVPHSRQQDDGPTRYAILDDKDTVTKVVFVNAEGRACEDLRYRPQATGKIPLALARLNKLALAQGPQPHWIRSSTTNSEDDGPSPVPEEYTPEQLREVVEVLFPRNGWRIVKHNVQRENEETRYAIIKPDGSVKRIVFVNEEGRVFEDLPGKKKEARLSERGSIKLGLGDFIFYSILVSKASLYSYLTFVSCTVAILIGLALTLLLLAFRGKALPALPISIFLGVSYYLLTRYLIEPWVEEIFILRLYM